MGVSTDAYLYFGFDIYEAEQGISDDLEESILKKIGIVYDPEAEAYEDPSTLSAAFNNALFDDIAEEFGLSINTHGSDDYQINSIVASIKSAYRGYPKEITSLEIDPIWIDNLKLFCERTGFEYKEPKWWLASYWG